MSYVSLEVFVIIVVAWGAHRIVRNQAYHFPARQDIQVLDRAITWLKWAVLLWCTFLIIETVLMTEVEQSGWVGVFSYVRQHAIKLSEELGLPGSQ